MFGSNALGWAYLGQDYAGESGVVPPPPVDSGCGILLADGSGFLLLANGTGAILLEQCIPAPSVGGVGPKRIQMAPLAPEDELALVLTLAIASKRRRRLVRVD